MSLVLALLLLITAIVTAQTVAALPIIACDYNGIATALDSSTGMSPSAHAQPGPGAKAAPQATPTETPPPRRPQAHLLRKLLIGIRGGISSSF